MTLSQDFPNGYDTELSNNGANLSQGQRQLIAIARAAVADPPVMILDEATSSIDTRTEAIVQRGMDKHGRQNGVCNSTQTFNRYELGCDYGA